MNEESSVHAIGPRDILTAMLMCSVLISLVFATLAKKAVTDALAQARPAGNVNVSINWPDGDTDVDLWLDGPGEPVPVGYSNRGGRLWNLLRDDLGNGTDATSRNYESASTRGVVPGTYRLNLHCFRCPVLPVPVDIEVAVFKEAGDKNAKTPAKVIFVGKTVLHTQGQERTAISFRMDADGNIDPASMNSVFKPLRSAKKG